MRRATQRPATNVALKALILSNSAKVQMLVADSTDSSNRSCNSKADQYTSVTATFTSHAEWRCTIACDADTQRLVAL